MSAINPVVLPPTRANTDQFAADSANNAAPAAPTDFAGTLQGVAAKPARKMPTGNDAAAPANGGETLPQAGKSAPTPAAAAPQAPPANPATAANPAPAPALPVVAPPKGKQPAKLLAAAAPLPVATSNPLPAVAAPAPPPVDPHNTPDAKSQSPGALPAIAPDQGAAPAGAAVPDATLTAEAAPPAASASDPQAMAKQAGDGKGGFDPLVGAATSAAAPVPTPAAAAAGTPLPPPVAQSLPSASPAPAPAPQSGPVTNAVQSAPGAQAGAAATVAARSEKPAATRSQTAAKPASPGTAKSRGSSATESSHAETSGVAPTEGGDGSGPHALQTAANIAASNSAIATVDSRTPAVSNTDPQPGALGTNAKALDATLAAQSPASDAAPGVHAAADGATTAGAGAAANTQSFANLVGGTIDKHAVAKSDVSGGGIDAGGAVQSLSQANAGNAPDAPAAAPTLKVGPSVDSSEFGQGVATQVSLMVDSNITSAKLQVSPPALGPIEVRIALQGDHASVQFTSHSAVTREALADSTPKLRDMLTAQGFGQVSVDISHRSFQERPSNAQAYEWGGKSEGIKSTPTSAVASLPAVRVSRSSVDAYA